MRWHALARAAGQVTLLVVDSDILSHILHDVYVRVRDCHIYNVRRPFRIYVERHYVRNAIDGFNAFVVPNPQIPRHMTGRPF